MYFLVHPTHKSHYRSQYLPFLAEKPYTACLLHCSLFSAEVFRQNLMPSSVSLHISVHFTYHFLEYSEVIP